MSQTFERLFSGRHSLSREQVVESQRLRMLAAVAECIMQYGYVDTTVEKIIKKSRVSRETFYQQFKNKQDCFIQSLDLASQILRATVAADYVKLPKNTRLNFEQIARAVLTSYFTALIENKPYARLFLVDVWAAGQAAIDKRIEVNKAFVEFVTAMLNAKTEEERFACEVLTGAISSLVTFRVGANDFDSLLDLVDPLILVIKKLFPNLSK